MLNILAFSLNKIKDSQQHKISIAKKHKVKFPLLHKVKNLEIE